LAKENNTAVPSIPVELVADTTNPSAAVDGPEAGTLNSAPLKAEEPSGEEVDLSEAFVVTDSGSSAPNPELPERLPATATPLPLFGLIGLLSLGAGVTLRLTAKATE
jgi:hypothetical protein